MGKVPAEIVEAIIDELWWDDASLRSCALAGRVFLPRSQQHIFSDILLPSPHQFRPDGDYAEFSEHCRRLWKTFERNRTLGQYVKYLFIVEGTIEAPIGKKVDYYASFRAGIRWIEHDVNLPLVLEAMTNLKQITFRGMEPKTIILWSSLPRRTIAAVHGALTNVTHFQLDANVTFASSEHFFLLFHYLPNIEKIFLARVAVEICPDLNDILQKNFESQISKRSVKQKLRAIAITDLSDEFMKDFFAFLMDSRSPIDMDELAHLTIDAEEMEESFVAGLLDFQSNDHTFTKLWLEIDSMDEWNDNGICTTNIGKFTNLESIYLGGMFLFTPMNWAIRILDQPAKNNHIDHIDFITQSISGIHCDLSELKKVDKILGDRGRYPALKTFNISIWNSETLNIPTPILDGCVIDMEGIVKMTLPKLASREEVDVIVVLPDDDEYGGHELELSEVDSEESESE